MRSSTQDNLRKDRPATRALRHAFFQVYEGDGLGTRHRGVLRGGSRVYGPATGFDLDRLGQRSVGIPSLRKTAINDAIRNGARCTRCGSSPVIPSWG